MTRLALLALLALSGAGAGGVAAAAEFTAVSGAPLVFPRDYGSHPGFRTEWWYVTGWLTMRDGGSLGFQVTFFRTNTGLDAANPSAFAPRQLLIGHAAVSDPARGRLWQDQRIQRAGFGLVEAAEGDTRVAIDDWRLDRLAGSVSGRAHYRTTIPAEDFSLSLELEETQPLLVHGVGGVSAKGPAAAAASYYYSLPHLKVKGTLARARRQDPVSGEAWFDHEWSSEYLDPQSAGWDWTGLNFDDGSALMAFRIRSAQGATRWAGGTWRSADGQMQVLEPSQVDFKSLREWTSPRTGIRYPVEWLLTAGPRQYHLRPLLDDQENDTRLSTGAIYWEGAVLASARDAAAGRGYLELTGYGERLRLDR